MALFFKIRINYFIQVVCLKNNLNLKMSDKSTKPKGIIKPKECLILKFYTSLTEKDHEVLAKRENVKKKRIEVSFTDYCIENWAKPYVHNVRTAVLQYLEGKRRAETFKATRNVKNYQILTKQIELIMKDTDFNNYQGFSKFEKMVKSEGYELMNFLMVSNKIKCTNVNYVTPPYENYLKEFGLEFEPKIPIPEKNLNELLYFEEKETNKEEKEKEEETQFLQNKRKRQEKTNSKIASFKEVYMSDEEQEYYTIDDFKMPRNVKELMKSIGFFSSKVYLKIK